MMTEYVYANIFHNIFRMGFYVNIPVIDIIVQVVGMK